jgi:hypothetical protein
VISNDDVFGDGLPDIRGKIFTDPAQSAMLKYDRTIVDCLTLQEAVLAWRRLGLTEKRLATITTNDATYSGFDIEPLYSASR